MAGGRDEADGEGRLVADPAALLRAQDGGDLRARARGGVGDPNALGRRGSAGAERAPRYR